METDIPRKWFYCTACRQFIDRGFPNQWQNRCNWCKTVMVEATSPDEVPSFTVNPLAATTAAQLPPDEPIILGRKVLIDKRPH